MLSLRAPPGCRRESPCTSGSIQLGALAHGAERSSQRSLWHGQTLTVLTPTQPLHWPQSSTSDFSMPGDLWPTGPCPGRRRRQRTSVRHVRRSGVVGESLLPGRSAPRVRTSTDGVEGIIRACIPLDKARRGDPPRCRLSSTIFYRSSRGLEPRMLGVSYEHICLAASWIMKTTGLLSGRVFPQLGWSHTHARGDESESSRSSRGDGQSGLLVPYASSCPAETRCPAGSGLYGGGDLILRWPLRRCSWQAWTWPGRSALIPAVSG